MKSKEGVQDSEEYFGSQLEEELVAKFSPELRRQPLLAADSRLLVVLAAVDGTAFRRSLDRGREFYVELMVGLMLSHAQVEKPEVVAGGGGWIWCPRSVDGDSGFALAWVDRRELRELLQAVPQVSAVYSAEERRSWLIGIVDPDQFWRALDAEPGIGIRVLAEAEQPDSDVAAGPWIQPAVLPIVAYSRLNAVELTWVDSLPGRGAVTMGEAPVEALEEGSSGEPK